jgi:hypothetical protein
MILPPLVFPDKAHRAADLVTGLESFIVEAPG